jgi:flavorubredoxin
MDTRVDEIAERIYRLSTCIPDIAPGGFTFNQFLIDAEEPLLYHTGMRGLFGSVSAALARVLPLQRLRWIAFSHVEADECGAVNEFLAAAPHAQVVHGQLGVLLSVNDMCDRPPRGLADGEVLDIGGAQLQRRMVEVATPHVPHNWESHLFYEQVTGTLFCGDLATQLGDGAAVTSEDILADAIAAEELFRQTSLGPAVGATYRRLAEFGPNTLAIMHGSSYSGDCARLLRTLAEVYDGMATGTAGPAQPLPAHDARQHEEHA